MFSNYVSNWIEDQRLDKFGTFCLELSCMRIITYTFELLEFKNNTEFIDIEVCRERLCSEKSKDLNYLIEHLENRRSCYHAIKSVLSKTLNPQETLVRLSVLLKDILAREKDIWQAELPLWSDERLECFSAIIKIANRYLIEHSGDLVQEPIEVELLLFGMLTAHALRDAVAELHDDRFAKLEAALLIRNTSLTVKVTGVQ